MSFAAVETYVTPPGNADYTVDVDAMNNFMDNAISRVDAAGKDVFLVMQAYDRSAMWTNPDALENFQQPVYLKAYNDPAVIGINMFSFNRPGGTKTYPEIQFRHYPIAERILGPIDWGVDTRFNISSHIVNEGSNITVAVRALTPEGGPTMRPITIDYTTVAGTALAGSDYVHKQGTLTFARGQSSKSITVQTLSDGAAEGTEVFYIRLSNGEGTNVGSPDKFTLSIINQ
jgi:hypothetical protein